jgi:hypothetical protein
VTEGIPFMITDAMKSQLRGLGYDDPTIYVMTPAEAHRLIDERIACPQITTPPTRTRKPRKARAETRWFITPRGEEYLARKGP